MTTIELTDQQRRAIESRPGKPVEVLDPATQQRYVLLAQEQYERVRPLLEQLTGPEPAPRDFEVAPGILRSQQAFWRDLPELLKNKRNRDKWVCYHGDERIGIAKSDVPLIKECLGRNLPRDEYCLFVIHERDLAPWEVEEVEALGPWHRDHLPPPS